MMLAIKVTTKLRLKDVQKRMKPEMRNATKHVAEIASRALIRNIYPVSDTGDARNSVHVEPSGELNHKVVAEGYLAQFEKGDITLKEYSNALYDWAVRRAEQGYRNAGLPQRIMSRYLSGNKYVLKADYRNSKGYRMVSMATEFARMRAKKTAEVYMRRAIR